MKNFRFIAVVIVVELVDYITMDTLKSLVDEALQDFERVLSFAGPGRTKFQIDIEILRRPHRQPKGLPRNKMAVYAFFLDGQALKVGKVGPNSGPRFTSQHYNAHSAASNLAASIWRNPNRVGLIEPQPQELGAWIKQHTDRMNLLVAKEAGGPFLSLLEAFLHYRWNPVFEGRDSLGVLNQ